MNNKSIIFIPLLLLILIVSILWWKQTGSLTIYFDGAAPAGQLPYILSKLLGMVALVCMAWQIIYSLCIKLQFIDIHWSNKIHPVLGLAVVLLSVTHIFLFFTAVSIRQDALALNLFLPNFKDYYHTHLSFGLMGLWLIGVVIIFGWYRRKRHNQKIAKFHKLYWLAITFIYLHALAVGSESQSLIGMSLYMLLAAVMAVLALCYFLRRFRIRQVLAS